MRRGGEGSVTGRLVEKIRPPGISSVPNSGIPISDGAVETPCPSAQTVIFYPPSYVERLDLAALFQNARPVEVELGAGDGSFLMQWAAENPETNFLAVERLLGRLRKIERKARRASLTNVRALRLEAAYCTGYLLPRASVSAFHIYFPDPWPKRKHRPNRLLNEAFTEVLRAALMVAGIVYLRTDDADYFEQMTRVFGANANFESRPTPERLAAVRTDFERHFNDQGIQTHRAAYRRVG